MIARSYMQSNLTSLNALYRGAKSAKQSLFYSKLAILELCGWIEESMDDIVLRCATRCLKDPDNIDYVKKNVIKLNYGFEYDKHFRGMLLKLLGIRQVERLENSVDVTKQARLKATLSALIAVRNAEAHTHLKGITRSINAPSTTISQFQDVYEGLIEYEAVIRGLKV